MATTSRDDKVLKGAQLQTYTSLVKKAINDAVGATTDENVIQASSSATTDIPIIIKGATSDSTAAHVGYDSGLTIKPQTHELKATSSANVTTLKPTEVSVTDGTNTTKITASGLTLPSGAKPSVTYTKSTGKLNVTVGGQTSADASLAVADNNNYGVVKVDTSMSTSSTNPVQNKIADAAIKAAAKTVKQSAATGSDAIPIMLEGSIDASNIGEARYTSDIQYKPSARETTISTNAATGNTSVTFKFVDGELQFGSSSNTINGSAYTGRATGTETLLSANSALNEDGASLIGYYYDEDDEATNVADALDDIYSKIGSGGEDSLSSRVSTLEGAVVDLKDGDNLIQGTNVTLTKDTTNHTVTIAAADPTVTQTSDTSTDNFIPLLLASGSSVTSPGATKYNSHLKYRPSEDDFQVTGSSTVDQVITPHTISLKNGVVTITSGSGNSQTSSTLSSTAFSGNAATATRATQDGSGNVITTTYATKDEVVNPTPVILQSLPTTQADIQNYIGKFVFVRNGALSTDARNYYDEYIVVGETENSTTTYRFERIGSNEVNVDIVYLDDTDVSYIWTNTAAAS